MNQERFEAMLENNPLRSWVREALEVKPMKAVAGGPTIKHALHIACGNGSATRLILKHFSVQRMSAVDRNGRLIAEACKAHAEPTLDFSAQDADRLSFGDGIFDAVFDLADLHNFADWKERVLELKRVLRPGGLLILEEISQETFSHAAGRLFGVLTDHPYDSMLTVDELRDHIVGSGFSIVRFQKKNPFGLLRYFILIARKG